MSVDGSSQRAQVVGGSGEWRVARKQWPVASSQWPVNAKRGDHGKEKLQNKANLLVVLAALLVGAL